MEERTMVPVTKRLKGSEYCPKCGNTGIQIDGSPCDCKFRAETVYESVSCLDIPDQYRGVIFNKFLLPKDVHESYGEYMTSLHDEIGQCRLHGKSICICSPISHGKTVFAYSCIEQLFRHGIPTFPLFDALEIKRIMLDVDMCRKPMYEVEHPEYMATAPYLFIKVPRVTTWEVYDTLATVIDRRVRRSNSTILLYDGSWESLIKRDSFSILSGMQGDGTYNTLEVKNWYTSAEKTEPVVQQEENIG